MSGHCWGVGSDEWTLLGGWLRAIRGRGAGIGGAGLAILHMMLCSIQRMMAA